VQKTYETAKSLALLFPDNLLPPGFTDPVLTAFANAILHCATSGEVAIMLNGAIEKADSKIVSTLADFYEKTTTRMDAFYDASLLPYPREAIISAMEREIVRTPLQQYADWVKAGAVFLYNFLEQMGAEPIPFIPLNGHTANTNELRKILTTADYKQDEDKSSRIRAVAEAENKKVEERIANALSARSERLAGMSQAEKAALFLKNSQDAGKPPRARNPNTAKNL
jgi:hypothetical protein